MVAVYTYRDVPQRRFTLAGQSYPEASPYDRLILDQVVRYVGDEVAIVAAETEEAATKALRLIKVSMNSLMPFSTLHRPSTIPRSSIPKTTTTLTAPGSTTIACATSCLLV